MMPDRRNWFLRWHYRIAVPLIWLAAMQVSWRHPGDEYGLFISSALPALWVPFVFPSGHLRDVLIPLALFGGLTMGLLGWGLDAVRVPRRLWFPLLLVVMIGLVVEAILGYPSYARAMAKNGSLSAYVSAATNLSLYLVSLFSLLTVGLTRLIQRRKRRQLSGQDSSHASDLASS